MTANRASDTFWNADEDQVTDAEWLRFLGGGDPAASGSAEPVTLGAEAPGPDPGTVEASEEPAPPAEGDGLDWLTTTALDDLLPDW